MKSNLLLLAVLLLLGGFFAYTQFNSGKDERTFKRELVNIQVPNVEELYMKAPKEEAMTYTKAGEKWTVQQGGQSYPVKDQLVESLLQQIAMIKPQRVAAMDQSKWQEMEVTDDLATRIKVKEGGTSTLDLYLGKFNFQQNQNPQAQMQQQQQPKISSFVRLEGDKEVYTVADLFAPSLNQKLAAVIDSAALNAVIE